MIRILLIAALVFPILEQTLFAQPGVAEPRSLSQTVQPESIGMSAEKLAKVVPALQTFVDEKKVAGAIVIVARRGKLALFDSVGWQDIDSGKPMSKDSILRIYSMSKPITSVAVMILVEEGKIGLDDAVSKHIPEFKGLQVFQEKIDGELKQVPANRAMTIRDLLRHTSGLTYGFFGNSPVDQAYQAAGVLSDRDTLQQTVDKLAQIPLLDQPGTRFNYSVSTDVLGHIVERASGQRLDQFFKQRIFDPLVMPDTAFQVTSDKADRFAHNYGPRQNPPGLVVVDDAAQSKYRKSPTLYSGGGGLVSTASDYLRFCQMLLNHGELDGTRILESETVKSMIQNQLPPEAYPISLGGTRDGVGFGFGFNVVEEKTDWTGLCRIGEYGWGGAASTHFWISPNDQLAVVVLTQLMPFSFQLESAVKPLVYDAIED